MLFKTTDTGNTCNPYLRLMGDLQKLKYLANMFCFGIFQIRYLLFFIILSLFLWEDVLFWPVFKCSFGNLRLSSAFY